MGVGTKRACRNGAVDTQHGPDVEGSSHPCTKGYYPKYGIFLTLTTTHVLIIHYTGICCKCAFCPIHIFLLCRLKTSQVTEIQNVHLFLDPLPWLQTNYFMHEVTDEDNLLPLFL